MKNKPYSIILWILLSLFCFRVLGQLIQSFFSVAFLPSFDDWHSGTLSYPFLVTFQFAIIVMYSYTCIRISKGIINPMAGKGKKMLILGSIYAFVMLARYFLKMYSFPAERWFGGCIPIFFHLILALFIMTLGLYHIKHGEKRSSPSQGMIKLSWTASLVVIFTMIPVWIFYQLLPSLLASELGIRNSEYSVVIEKKVKIETDDGEFLRADLYRPERIDKAPTILVRIPLDDNLKGRVMSNILGRLWAERGYNVMIQGVRGRFGSTGIHIPFQTEREDGITTLKWLHNQSWHDGKIGMWGGSYFGYTQWVLSDQEELGLRALFTQISSSNMQSFFYPGGAFSFESALFWATRSFSDVDTPLNHEKLKSGYEGAPLIDADRRVVEDIPFFKDWVVHTKTDDFWQKIDGVKRASKTRIPILSMAGWFDPFLSGQIKDFEDISRDSSSFVCQESRLIIGPWAHAETVKMPNGYEDRHYRFSSIAPAIDWYDKHLLGNLKKKEPRVKIFTMGINEWRFENEFPLKGTNYTNFYLSSPSPDDNKAGQLLLSILEDTLVQSYIYDPSNPILSLGGAVLGERAGIKIQNSIEEREDVLLFSTGLLEFDMEVTGKIKLVLYVSTNVKNTDFVAKLIDVYPNGDAYNLSEGIIRTNFEGVDEIKKVEIDLNPTSNVFQKGHQIRLEIMSSSFPRYSLNYNTEGNNWDEIIGKVAEQKIYTGKIHSSHLVLPIIPSQRSLALD